jgi:membrane protease YdiL (CAAX protease family)
MAPQRDYLRATCHPWPCLLFVLPLLAAYEFGVVYVGGAHPEGLRNGADSWLRQGLTVVGLRQHYWAPVLLLVLMLLWTVRRWGKRPGDLVGVLCGMVLESVAFALGLWGVSRGLGPLVDYFGVELALKLSTDPVVGQVITFVGAGIYEEMLFRLVLFSALFLAVEWVGGSRLVALGLAAILSSLVFSAAHHVGPFGENFDGYTFLFRTVAGLYFALLYQGRGFGIAVGAHACYDVVVGVAVR